MMKYYLRIKFLVSLFLICFGVKVYSQNKTNIFESSARLFNNPDSGLVVAQKWFLEAVNKKDIESQIFSLI